MLVGSGGELGVGEGRRFVRREKLYGREESRLMRMEIESKGAGKCSVECKGCEKARERTW